MLVFYVRPIGQSLRTFKIASRDVLAAVALAYETNVPFAPYESVWLVPGTFNID